MRSTPVRVLLAALLIASATACGVLGKPADCGACKGKGSITCSRCNASGKTTCLVCLGSKLKCCDPCEGRPKDKTECPTCKSAPYDKNCKTCAGAGSVDCRACESGKDAAGKTCASCGGAGTKKCIPCIGSRTVACRCRSCCHGLLGGNIKVERLNGPCGICKGNGLIECASCRGAKTMVCKACDGKGKYKSKGGSGSSRSWDD